MSIPDTKRFPTSVRNSNVSGEVALQVPQGVSSNQAESEGREKGDSLLSAKSGAGAFQYASEIDKVTIERTEAQSILLDRELLAQIATSDNQRNMPNVTSSPLPLSNLANGIVGWESQDDPDMPLNFPNTKKWILLFLLSSINLISPSMFAPAVSFMDVTFNNESTSLSSLTVSIFVLGYAVGPILLAPLSEVYGRRMVLAGANICFCIWQLASALAPNLPSLITFRSLTEQRGLATSIWTFAPIIGPIIGPICGGFIGQQLGWRWVFWILFIASTVVTIGIECLNRETNHQYLIHQKVKTLRKELRRSDLRSCYETPGSVHSSGPAEFLESQGLLCSRILHVLSTVANATKRLLKMLFFSPIVFLLSLYMSLVYGLYYLLLTTLTSVMQNVYSWPPQLTGLAYISLGAGFVGGLLVVGKISDPTVVRMTKANHGVFEPEMRLPACIFFSCFTPLTFFWYGWTTNAAIHWSVPLIGLMPFGFGVMGVFIPMQAYIIDSFPSFAASGIAALVISRSLLGALLPLAGPAMYSALGLGWGNSALGFIAIALIPAPLLIFKFGRRIRINYALDL